VDERLPHHWKKELTLFLISEAKKWFLLVIRVLIAA